MSQSEATAIVEPASTPQPSKASIARNIFEQHFGTLPRKDIIALFKSEAALTDNGSATYYQKFKKNAEQPNIDETTAAASTEAVST